MGSTGRGRRPRILRARDSRVKRPAREFRGRIRWHIVAPMKRSGFDPTPDGNSNASEVTAAGGPAIDEVPAA